LFYSIGGNVQELENKQLTIMELDDIQKHIEQVINEQNNRSIPEFEGYSPFDMHHILHFTFETNSPLSLRNLEDFEYEKIPMLNTIKYFLILLKKEEEIKLTAKGFLPTKIVKEIYNQGFIKEYQFTSGISKLYKESESVSVNLTRLLVELAGLTKKRNGKISLTKNGEKILSNNKKLFGLIFKSLTTKFNWSYYDGYKDNQIGQFGFGFTFILLSKYGNRKQMDSFYSEKYFKAFPQFLNEIKPSYGTVESYAGNCYSYRTFEIIFEIFGLVKIEKEGKGFEQKMFITKTEIFDRLIKVRPPNNVQK